MEIPRMKIKIIAVLFAAALALFAQNTDHVNVRFSTPVMVGETLMPAGDVHIQIQRGSGDSVTLAVRSAEGPAVNLLVNRFYDETGESIYNPHVVLRRTGDVVRFEKLLLADRT